MTVMYGGRVTFAGIATADVANPESYAGADAVIIGAPFDGGTTYRPGARFGPQAIRTTDYLPQDGCRPHLALGVDPLVDDRVVDAGDVLMPPGEMQQSLARLELAVASIVSAGALPVVLGGDHSIALANVIGVARHHPPRRLGLVHFDAHSDAAETHYGSAVGHGTWVRRLIEGAIVPGTQILQIGQRNGGSLPGREWREAQGIRSYEMGEIGRRGLDACLDDGLTALRQSCEAVFLSIDIDVVDPAFAPATGTPEPGGLTSRQLLDAVARCAVELRVAGMDIVEVAPPYDGPGAITALLANRLVLEALAGFCRRRRDGAVAVAGAPTVTAPP